jgi:hypothetical protein
MLLQRNLDPGAARGEFFGMNAKPLCKLLSISCLFIGCAVAARANLGDLDVGRPIDQGDGSLAITVEAKTAFNRDVDSMKVAARVAAASYCDAQHKQLQVVSLDGKKPWFSTGYTSATIIFRAVDPNTTPVVAAPSVGSPVVATASPMAAPQVSIVESTDELYAALSKLDDLRKKGILTDDEFQAEKKKILSHTN